MSENIKEIKRFILDWEAENASEFYDIADNLWRNPELSMQEFNASAVQKAALAKHGFEIEEGAGGMPTAFVASYGSGHPVIGLNCEYDALPGLSQKNDSDVKDPIREGAPGQGCGHNILGTAATKASIALRYAMEKFGLKGTIKVFGAIAEELCLGKPFLARAGAFEGVDAFLDWHPWSYNRADYDTCPAYFSVKFSFKGRTAHGNAPWHGRSALDGAQLTATATEYLREHLSPGNGEEGANTFNYTYTDTGPEFPSVVPDRATIWYIGRFGTTDVASDALARITKCAEGAALATETEVSRELITATNHKIPNKTLAKLLHRNFEELGTPKFTEEEQALGKRLQEAVGAEQNGLPESIWPFGGGYTAVCDTPEYSWNAPYAWALIAIAPGNIGWHNWIVTRLAASSVAKKGMDKAANLLAVSVAELLTDEKIVSEAQAELKERLGGKTYKCQLPDDLKPPLHLNRETMEKYPIADKEVKE